MSDISLQASAVQVLADRLKPQHLLKHGIASRRSEADHLIAQLKDAVESLYRLRGLEK